jgi:hypothetical protein
LRYRELYSKRLALILGLYRVNVFFIKRWFGMSSNILSGIVNIASFNNYDLGEYGTSYSNRINNMGECLEYYVKDALADSFEVGNKDEIHSSVFSYLGNQNNPPDMILRNGDAFEVKKLESPHTDLALSNSPPKNRLYRDDHRITASCRECDGENWQDKDIYYVVGYIKAKLLRYIFFVHGVCYAADPEVYYRFHQRLREGIGTVLNSSDYETSDTSELGRIRRIDPLGITNFRIRGLWYIANPARVFDYIYNWNQNNTFSLVAIIENSKYYSYSKNSIDLMEAHDLINIQDCLVKNPNNPANRIEAKLITYNSV